MTKKKMIATIQQEEAAAWLELRKAIYLFGREADVTQKNRREWASIHALMEKLDIVSDFTLPDNIEARGYAKLIFDKEEQADREHAAATGEVTVRDLYI
jgi:hypothetical protein